MKITFGTTDSGVLSELVQSINPEFVLGYDFYPSNEEFRVTIAGNCELINDIFQNAGDDIWLVDIAI